MSSGAPREDLERLQAELLRLRERYGPKALALRRTPASLSPSAPFPVTLTFAVDPPREAANYDVGIVTLTLTLDASILERHSEPAQALGDAVPAAARSGDGGGLAVSVACPELPAALADAIAARLKHAWHLARQQQQEAGSQALCLDAPALSLQQQFVSHLSCLPGLLEPYQSVDAAGATVRRYAVINQQDPLPTESSAPAPPPLGPSPAPPPTPSISSASPVPLSPPSGLLAPPRAQPGARLSVAATEFIPSGVAGSGGSAASRSEAAAAVAASHDSISAAHDPSWGAGAASSTAPARRYVVMTHADLTRDLQYLQRRYRAAFQITAAGEHGHSGKQQAVGDQQQQQQHDSRGLPPAAPAASAVEACGCPRHVLLELVPTDPAWQARAPIKLELTAEPVPMGKAPSSTPSAAVPAPPPTTSPSSAPPPAASSAATGAQPSAPPELSPRRPSAPPGRPPVLPTRIAHAPLLASFAPSTPQPTYKVTLSVSPLSPMPAWLSSYLDAELARELAGAVAEAEDSRPAANGSADFQGSSRATGHSLRPAMQQQQQQQQHRIDQQQRVVSFSASVKRAVLHLENYAGVVAEQAEAAAVRAGHRTRLGPASGAGAASAAAAANGQRRAGPGRGAGAGDEDGDGFWSVGDDGSEDGEGSGTSRGGSELGSDEFSDDGYGEDGSRHGVAEAPGAGPAATGKVAAQRAQPGPGVKQRQDEAPGLEREADVSGSSRSGSSEASSAAEEEEEEEVGQRRGGDEATFQGEGVGGDGGSSAGAWHCVLEGLMLDEVEVAEMIRVPFQIACSRCGGTGTLTISSGAVAAGPSAGAPAAGQHQHQHSQHGQQQQQQQQQASRALEASDVCPTCRCQWRAAARPRFVHGGANVLCALKLQGCVPRDVLPSLLAVQCCHCSSVMTMRGVQVGLPHGRTCSSCHHRLALTIAAVSFLPRGPPAVSRRTAAPAGGPGRTSRTARTVTAPLTVGLPLPDRGTCKHYRHSYRWLRFPCCGARFPCDICHDEASDHTLKWASRMVCGFCSTEQPVTSQCTACGKKLACAASNAMGKTTRYWEGGAGCRDTKNMTRKDPHKYRGKSKTKSAKSSRVGPKAWSKELKEKQQA